MTQKQFTGYLIIGAHTREDAENEKGLLLWSHSRPSLFRRLCFRFLGLYWIDKEKIMVVKDTPTKGLQDKKQHTELYKVRHVRPVSKNPATSQKIQP
jgi:hypothetical protein